jgi:hypothetical protein
MYGVLFPSPGDSQVPTSQPPAISQDLHCPTRIRANGQVRVAGSISRWAATGRGSSIELPGLQEAFSVGLFGVQVHHLHNHCFVDKARSISSH